VSVEFHGDEIRFYSGPFFVCIDKHGELDNCEGWCESGGNQAIDIVRQYAAEIVADCDRIKAMVEAAKQGIDLDKPKFLAQTPANSAKD